MKNFTINLIILNFLFASSVSAQNNWNQNCGVSVQVRTSQFQPDTIVNGDSVIVVPTVFHILTQGGAENISKSHVYRALQILNQDFNRQNSDTFDIPSPFHPVRGNPRIEFRLARIDPQGNCTDGIDRIYTPQEGIYGNLYDNFGWNHTKYLNIYIVKWIENEPLRSGLAYLASIDSGQTQPDNSDFIEAPYYVIGDGFNGFLAPQRSHLLTEICLTILKIMPKISICLLKDKLIVCGHVLQEMSGELLYGLRQISLRQELIQHWFLVRISR